MTESAQFDTDRGGQIEFSQQSGKTLTVHGMTDDIVMTVDGVKDDELPNAIGLVLNGGHHSTIYFKNETVAEAALCFGKHLTE